MVPSKLSDLVNTSLSKLYAVIKLKYKEKLHYQ